ASLRDIFVKGAIPVAIFDDLHVADDGDVAKLFDFIAGVRTVSQLCQVPLVCGSTLRVGGDMVLGDRMVSSVGAVGVIKRRQWLKARREIKPGDSIIMSEGSGGGTIATTAIYSGNHEAVLETLTVNTLRLCEHLLNSDCAPLIHAMTDVTNGGIRGDANTICDEAKVGLVFDSSQLEKAVNERIMNLLQKLSIDHLGVSLDSVLVFTPRENENEVLSHIKRTGIKALVVGEVKDHPKKALILMKDKTQALTPKFRESAYTWVKKIVGEENPKDRKRLEKRASAAYLAATVKSNELVTLIRNNTISK
ncbi:MAG: AIR synthase-related protein, partial [Candidatus Bathyarchaeia archaeon]